jgi:DNA-binding NtrC family response regulator
MSPHDSTILVVEDEALIALSIEAQLQDMGFDTMVATTIEQAFDLLSRPKICLAVLDYNVHGQNTTGIAEALRLRSVPFVVCSGSQFQDMATTFQGVPVISKPYADDALESAVRKAMSTSPRTRLNPQASNTFRPV